ncbi:SOS response-associated peptidase family protein [Thalassotalea psychrophila]|uniref:Abasic site processing protein n=1 Tax=Thalassotalea psychrophila TaxID=3065647 RepID=A0ABY9TUU9_9GAMM|nr:SOS response-associated peptidase family protein [Colwelliaceae bacterium SQ149]
MCGRFSVNKQQIESWVTSNLLSPFACADNSDLCPSQSVSTIIETGGELAQQDTLWGIKPAWANKLLINGQAESITEKPTFKQAFKKQRCLIPFSTWFEWKTDEQGKKQKYQFANNTTTPLLMAGIYYQAKDGDKPLLVTLTTESTEQCSQYHSRMPLIIAPNSVNEWFSDDIELVAPLLATIEQPFQITAA